MSGCKITVLKKMYDVALAQEYFRPELLGGPCDLFEVGQEFIVGELGHRPPDFACDWAWNDLQKALTALTLDGDLSRWMKDAGTFVTCCTDGIKPVVFKLERIKFAA